MPMNISSLNFFKDALKGIGASQPKRSYVFGNRQIAEEALIAEGGYAYVYKARDVNTNEVYALKKFLCQDSFQFHAAVNEAKTQDSLGRHPNIIKLCGFLQETENQNKKWVIMLLEFCDGHLLKYMDERGGKLNEKEVASCMADICSAVSVLHEKSIQHRDLKIENVLLGLNDRKWKLCDFGSCSTKIVDPSQSSTSDLLNEQDAIDKTTTMMYRPPELCDVAYKQVWIINTQVDIWMIGCILFTLMFFRHPFQDETSLAILNARYRLEKHSFSNRLEDVMHWCLAMKPAERPTILQLSNLFRGWDPDGGEIELPAEVMGRKQKLHRLAGMTVPLKKKFSPIDTEEYRRKLYENRNHTLGRHGVGGSQTADFVNEKKAKKEKKEKSEKS
eukprot:gene829-1114_t